MIWTALSFQFWFYHFVFNDPYRLVASELEYYLWLSNESKKISPMSLMDIRWYDSISTTFSHAFSSENYPTVDGSEIPRVQPPFGCTKPCKLRDKLPFPQLVIAGSGGPSQAQAETENAVSTADQLADSLKERAWEGLTKRTTGWTPENWLWFRANSCQIMPPCTWMMWRFFLILFPC